MPLFPNLDNAPKVPEDFEIREGNEIPARDDFFLQSFAGQASAKWHYGICHSFLRLLEDRIIDLQEVLRGEKANNLQHSKRGRPRRNWATLYEKGHLLRNKISVRRADSTVSDFTLEKTIWTGDISQFDWAELWQTGFTFVVILLPTLGAFILAYYTPSVGLGCRCAGYLMFAPHHHYVRPRSSRLGNDCIFSC